MTTQKHIRSSGILAHISSLPSPHGIGDIGYSSWKFIDFLNASGQSLWQFLPTVPTNPVFDNSPYMGNSAFAGSPLLISLDLLKEEKLLKNILPPSSSFSEYQTDFKKVTQFKTQALQTAFQAFNKNDKAFLSFIKGNKWLNDYCLFMSLKEANKQKAWFEWPQELADRQPDALSKAKKTTKKTPAILCF